MAVDLHGNIYPAPDLSHQIAHPLRGSAAVGVHHGQPVYTSGRRHGFGQLLQEFFMGAGGVDHKQINRKPFLLRIFGNAKRLFDHSPFFPPKLVFQARVANRQFNNCAVNPTVFRDVNVFLHGAAQACDFCPEAGLGNRPQAALLRLGNRREACLDVLHTGVGQALRNLHFLLSAENNSRRLFPVTQGRIVKKHLSIPQVCLRENLLAKVELAYPPLCPFPRPLIQIFSCHF